MSARGLKGALKGGRVGCHLRIHKSKHDVDADVGGLRQLEVRPVLRSFTSTPQRTECIHPDPQYGRDPQTLQIGEKRKKSGAAVTHVQTNKSEEYKNAFVSCASLRSLKSKKEQEHERKTERARAR